MATVFVALQCCQCSTMQARQYQFNLWVKQQKKSSNKWTCVVCNQKQSARKVFARGFMAKDVRKFVQSFNMSRKQADENADQNPNFRPQITDSSGELTEYSNLKKRSTDWSEYIDPEEDTLRDSEENGEGENSMEPKCVTELPKEMFKKPKINNSAIVLDNEEDGTKLFKPSFSKRNTVSNDKFTSRDESRRHQPRVTQKRSSACSRHSEQFYGNLQLECENRPPNVEHQTTLATKSSKWSHYIMEDDAYNDSGHMQEECRSETADFTCHWSEIVRVEDDIHPDFK
ncbi:MRN complex-interacting protein [Dillenia turbinata]|uniref:MRN complex-interacting protein n=1 Tax=Dillenia turbinata TaxID=194707 RepID=A0AAN8W1P4_9MAGN